MPINTDYLSMKSILALLSSATLSVFITQHSHAQAIDCNATSAPSANRLLCSTDLKQARLLLNEKLLTAHLVTDAPTELIHVTQMLWLKRAQQCQSKTCVEQQIEERIEQLNFYTSMNQSLTQHFIQYNQGKIASPTVHIMVHQLSKDRIKIEGTAYLNPNNKPEQQQNTFLAYTSPQQKTQILDNDRRCNYQFTFHKAMLIVNSTQKECQRFSGTYRRYD